MKSFDKLSGDPTADASAIAEAIFRNTNDNRIGTTYNLLKHFGGILANKSNTASMEITLKDVGSIQATYLREHNPQNHKNGFRQKDKIGKASATNIELLVPTILPVSVHFDFTGSGFRLDFGKTGKSSKSSPVFRSNYPFGQAKYALYEWYKACKAIEPLSAVNEYSFSVAATVLHSQILRMQRR